MRSRRIKKGFTLAELLIVVAVIAVLVAVAIPVFKGSLDKSKEAACASNRRSLYSEIVSEHIMSGRPFSELFDELVGHAGKCPCGGVFSWQDREDTGVINCDYHDGGGSGSGGSGGRPVLHGTANMSETKFDTGAVIQDETGTCVIMHNLWSMWNAYSGGMKAAQLAENYTNDAKLVDASDVKDSSFTGTLKTGDLYYDADSDTFYYVTIVTYETWPQSAWIPLVK